MTYIEMLGLPDQNLYRLKELHSIHKTPHWTEVIRDKKILAIRVGNAWRIPKEALETYLQSRSNMAD